MRRPFLPSDQTPRTLLKDWRRATTVTVVAQLTQRDTHQVARHLYGSEEGDDIIARAAVSPASTSGWGQQLASVRVGAFLQSLRSRSAASFLFEAGMRIDMSATKTVTLPRMASGFPPDVAWVLEGAPIPAISGALGADTLGPPKKLAAIAGLTDEIGTYSAEVAETIIEDLLLDAMARALDASLFSNAAATSARPAGILNGVTPIAATTSMAHDVGALFKALGDAGAGGSEFLLFASLDLAGVALVLPNEVAIIPTPFLSSGTVVAVDARAFASGFDDVPRVEISRDSVIHWEDSAPQQIGAAGSPNVVAAPARSGFQEMTASMRAILRAAWVVRREGAVQWITGAEW